MQIRLPSITSGYLRRPVLAGLVALFAGTASAEISWRDIQFGGFASQGYVVSNGNNYPFDSIDGTFDFRELGINASTTLGSRVRIGAQLFAQRLGEYGQDKVKLDWAVLDYNVRQEFGVRVGRVKFPKGLYGEALDLDSIRPFIFLPMSIYNPIVRDFNSAINGGLAYGSVSLGSAGSVDYKVFYGYIPMNPDQGVADFFNTTSLFARSSGVKALGMDYSSGGQLFWSTPINGLRAGFSFSTFAGLYGKGPFAYYPAVDVKLSTKHYDTSIFSAEYVRDAWTFAAEWQHVAGTFAIVSPLSSSHAPTATDSWYVSVARRLNDKFEVGTYYSVQEDKHTTPTDPSASTHNRDWAVSVRYDIDTHLALKVEGHYVDGYYNVFNTPRTPNATLDDHSTFVAAKLSLSF